MELNAYLKIYSVESLLMSIYLHSSDTLVKQSVNRIEPHRTSDCAVALFLLPTSALIPYNTIHHLTPRLPIMFI